MSTDHKVVGLQYAMTALVFLLVGFLLMLLIRWQLAWPTSPLPPALALAVGQNNAPGGFMLPEFYNQLVAMHGTVMVFLAVVPLLTGAFGNYLVPLHVGAPDMAFPRLNAASYWLYLAGGLLMLSGFFVEGGAAASGWTSYAPLAVLASRGQDFWLGGMFLVGLSATLNSLNVITTIVQLRAEGLTFMRLSFFVWAQLVSALLLLLAFPALQAAAIFQLMDRTAGTSFFLPSGLLISGIPLQGPSGGGSPLLWQHLFWFLAHPEVYVLILPAFGIVAEIIANNTRRPLWGYRGMVWATLAIGVLSLVVWAHHMFLTGMGTRMSAFFQITTMVISIPSVVLVTSLIMSLWGGAIRFTTPMLFALAFLPMFGLGGLTGLPLGLAASDITLHDTWYVVGHFHYVVAPGTIFAIFAGIYHWFPKVTGRTLNHRLGVLHFWGSFIAMNAIFLPMFTLGLRGVNRRLYDAGQQYALAQGTAASHLHMTLGALALGLLQLPFLVNLVMSLRRGSVASQNPWDATTLEWEVASPPPPGNFAVEPRVHRGAYEYSVPGAPRDFVTQGEPA
jgi:cytochrome c oxidase subunit 1